jgi:hypothetical protein
MMSLLLEKFLGHEKACFNSIDIIFLKSKKQDPLKLFCGTQRLNEP